MDLNLVKLIALRIKYTGHHVVLHSSQVGGARLSDYVVVSGGVRVGNNSSIGKGTKLSTGVIVGAGLNIGDYTAINQYTIIDYADVGNFTSIGPYCHIAPGNHAIDYVSCSQKCYAKRNILGIESTSFEPYSKKTIIGNDVWIGTGVVIMQGVTIGDGSVIGAGSVVTHDVPPYSIYVGNPARLLRKRFNNTKIEYLLSKDLFGRNYEENMVLIKDLIMQQNNWECE